MKAGLASIRAHRGGMGLSHVDQCMMPTNDTSKMLHSPSTNTRNEYLQIVEAFYHSAIRRVDGRGTSAFWQLLQ
jgi:hypothetical protein